MHINSRIYIYIYITEIQLQLKTNAYKLVESE